MLEQTDTLTLNIQLCFALYICLTAPDKKQQQQKKTQKKTVP